MTAEAVKLLGALLLTAAGALLGWDRTREKKQRAALLRELSASLGLMADELSLLRTPLPSVFEKLRGSPFFQLLHAGFGSEALETLWTRAAASLDLGEAERASLSSLGAVVGRYDAPRQTAEIALVRARLDRAAEDCERELAGRARSYAGLGACLGAMLSVILF